MVEKSGNILPAGPLMIEHRLIERMIAVIRKEAEHLEAGSELNTLFIKKAVDFIRTYADKCHHGKEEDILFKELLKKELSKEHFRMVNQLIAEHKYGRKTLKELEEAGDRYGKGDKKAKADALNGMKALAAFYPNHIEKEDKHFFLPCMDYFSREEKDNMLEEFRKFDAALIHGKYRAVVKQMEESRNV